MYKVLAKFITFTGMSFHRPSTMSRKEAYLWFPTYGDLAIKLDADVWSNREVPIGYAATTESFKAVAESEIEVLAEVEMDILEAAKFGKLISLQNDCSWNYYRLHTYKH